MNQLPSWGSLALLGLELVATAAFALSGVIEAVRRRMDVVGVCVVGFVTAFGGGTLRDVLLDHRPFFWVQHQSVLIGVFLLCIAANAFLRQRHMEPTVRTLLWPDAVGLGLFCASGVHLAHSLGMPPLVAILMGVVTGVFGGILRDITCNEIPVALHDHRPYAVCAFAGGAVYVLLAWAGAPDWSRLAAGAVVTLVLRSLALWRGWRVPGWRP